MRTDLRRRRRRSSPSRQYLYACSQHYYPFPFEAAEHPCLLRSGFCHTGSRCASDVTTHCRSVPDGPIGHLTHPIPLNPVSIGLHLSPFLPLPFPPNSFRSSNPSSTCLRSRESVFPPSWRPPLRPRPRTPRARARSCLLSRVVSLDFLVPVPHLHSSPLHMAL